MKFDMVTIVPYAIAFMIAASVGTAILHVLDEHREKQIKEILSKHEKEISNPPLNTCEANGGMMVYGIATKKYPEPMVCVKLEALIKL